MMHSPRLRAWKPAALVTALAMAMVASGCAPARIVADPAFEGEEIPVGAASVNPLVSDEAFFDMMHSFPLMQRAIDDAVVMPGMHGAYGLQTVEDESEAEERAFDLVRSEHYTPQGLAIGDGQLFVSAYDHDHALKSVIFVFTTDGQYIKTIGLNDAAHVGGLGYDRTTGALWVADHLHGQAAISAIAQEAIDAYDITQLAPIEYRNAFYVDTLEQVSTLDFSADGLWASYFTNDDTLSQIQFFTLDFSEPDENGDVFLTDIGDESRAYVGEHGRQHVFADLAFHAPAEVQGTAFSADHLYISQSFGTKNSTLTRFDLDVTEDAAVFDNAITVELPPYLEQVAISHDDTHTIHPLFESAQPTYRAKVDVFVDRIVSISRADFEETAKREPNAPEITPIDVLSVIG